MMLVGAATPPGRLAAAIATAAEMAPSGDVAVDVLNLAETPIDICDGRPPRAKTIVPIAGDRGFESAPSTGESAAKGRG
jgi:hypothetical protein